MIKKANKGKLGNTHDNVMTPIIISKLILEMLPIKKQDVLLEPCRGTGNIFNSFPKENKKYFCEINEGKDFFSWFKSVDWIITNPPYSIFDAFLEHSFKVANNVVFLCPLSKLVSSMGRMRLYKNYGGAVKLRVIAASKCNFPFGFPCAIIWFKKGYKGSTDIEIL